MQTYGHGHTRARIWSSLLLAERCPVGCGEGRAGLELLRCSFVYTDGFQMLGSDWSATERWGAAQQFRVCANKLGLRQL